ncbi:MAG TPA: pilus assembly protein N-terminal domain-containing protein [Acidobacteriota bacterium]|jgi:pilus assembly protein CpaC|nr:pilus assembly protein N-terminal domain-containing protein [Acidobacteriota bacterium]
MQSKGSHNRFSRILLCLLLTPLAPHQMQAQGQQGGLPEPAPQFALPAMEGPMILRMLAGKSLVVNSPEMLKRVSVTDPAVASSVIISPNQVLIHGHAPGTVTLLLWDERERTRSFDLQVEFDLAAIREIIARSFPKESIQITQSGSSLLVSGKVFSKDVADRILALLQTQTKNVVNLLEIAEKDSDEVLLQVRFAEVERTAIQQIGLNIISTGAANTFGSVSTQQFEQIRGNVGSVPLNVQLPGGTGAQGGSLVTGAIGNKLPASPGIFGLSDLLNIFVFRPDLNLGATIRALEQKNLLQILAEPNLLALDGREATFLAGGEFPFPVVQGGTNFTAVTIQFHDFGVRLKFTPNILSDGRIRLKVEPEVSSLDFSNALTISGFLVPALSTRKAQTEVELRDGQSFAIAGLIDNRLTEVASKIPALGDIPIIGKLFRSRNLNRAKTELLVMITPTRVKPLAPGQVPPLPGFVRPFLEGGKFDGKVGEVPPGTGQKPPP